MLRARESLFPGTLRSRAYVGMPEVINGLKHKVGHPSENVPPGGASLGYGDPITKFCMDIVYEVKMLSFAARYMSTRLEGAIVFHQATGRRKISQLLKGIPKFEYVGEIQTFSKPISLQIYY
jgi:hypothetical protein